MDEPWENLKKAYPQMTQMAQIKTWFVLHLRNLRHLRIVVVSSP
jgi:hypothetical protein